MLAEAGFWSIYYCGEGEWGAKNFESWARSKSSSLVAMALLIFETRLWFGAGGRLLADLLRLTAAVLVL